MFCQVKKGKIRLFFPHPLHAVLCHCSRLLPVENNIKTPWNLQLEWRSEGRGAEMFSEVTPFEDNISSILLAIVGRIVVTHLT